MSNDTIKKSDFEFFKKVTPNYFVTIDSSLLGDRPDKIRCRSNSGIDDEEKWTYLILSFELRWRERFIEVNHDVCTGHTDFTIYLKPE